MERKIELKEQPPQMVLGKRFRSSMAKVAEDVGAGYGALFAYLGELGEFPSGAPFALFYGDPEGFDPEDFEMELCVPVSRALQGRGEIVAREIPGGLAAVTIHKGPYSAMEPAYGDLKAWMAENGFRHAGPAREVYLNDPGQVTEDELLTEVSIPVVKT
ncbi:MAG: GyrI-like domain-containing protein [Actinobacteria bacterium]|nr:GyrI-like domain-containing protein [Actinomycetota bacterium]